METVSSLLARMLGAKDAPDTKKTPSLADLPESLRKLAEAINGNAAAVSKGADGARSRQDKINTLQQQFNSNLQEFAAVMAALDATQGNSLRQAERLSRREDERHKREEAAARRSEKIEALRSRQGNALSNAGVGLLGALFGGGIADFASNVLKAKDKTKSDIAELSEAIYTDKVMSANDEKLNAFDEAEAVREEATAKAATVYKDALESNVAKLGSAVQQAKESDSVLSATDAAKKAAEDAKASRSKIEAEGAARIAEASRPAPAPSPAEMAAHVREPAPSISPEKPAPIIVNVSGDDAIADAKLERVKAAVAARNMEAEAAVSAASDKFMEVSKAEGAAPAEYAGAVVQGEAAVAGIQKAGMEAAGIVKEAVATEAETRASAEMAARDARNEAFDEKAAGNVVSAPEQKSIGMVNMATGAIAPPAIAIIGKVMEKFSGLFPVIGQTGNALIEMGTALPATVFTVGGQLLAGITYVGSELRDALWTPDVRKRYNKSDIATMKMTGKSRAELFGKAQESNLSAYRDISTDVRRGESSVGLATASRGPVRSNARPEFTSTDIPYSSAGAVHVAREVPETKTRQPSVPASISTERPLGVIPVGPSNGSVDSWRR